MEASGRPGRGSRVRLLLLTAIAFVGYEFVLYRHWMTSVPLIPTATIALLPDRVPIGFTRSGDFLLGRRPSQIFETRGVAGGPIEVRSFPAGEVVADRLAFGDRIAATLPVSIAAAPSEFEYSYYDFGGGFRFLSAPGASQGTRDASSRVPTFYCLDRDRFLCLENGALQAYDPNANRVTWTLSRVQSVVSVKGAFAFVMRFRDGEKSRRPDFVPGVVSLHDGRCEQLVVPGNEFELSDISPDGRLFAYRVTDALEVWSIPERSRLWRKTTRELGTRELKFWEDGQAVVNCWLDENGEFQSAAFRAADGKRLPTGFEPAEPFASRLLPLATSGSRYAFFHKFASRARESEWNRWLGQAASRVGLFMRQADDTRLATLFDVQRGRPMGVIDISRGFSLLTASDGKGFAIHRQFPPVLEFYPFPPRSNWAWWSLRAIGLPVALVLLVSARSVYGRRRRLKDAALLADVSSSTTPPLVANER